MTCRLVASCCQSWGSLRFCAFRLVVASPRSNPIAVVAPAGHRGRGRPFREHGRFPVSSFLPLEGCSSPAADARHRTSPLQSSLVPSNAFEGVHRPVLPGPVPLRGCLLSVLVSRDQPVPPTCSCRSLDSFDERPLRFRVAIRDFTGSDATASLGLCGRGDSPDCVFADALVESPSSFWSPFGDLS